MKELFSFGRLWRRHPASETGRPVFRCYFLDAVGSIQSSENVQTDNLDQAVERVLVMLAERPQHAGFELWQGTRRLHTHIRTRL